MAFAYLIGEGFSESCGYIAHVAKLELPQPRQAWASLQLVATAVTQIEALRPQTRQNFNVIPRSGSKVEICPCICPTKIADTLDGVVSGVGVSKTAGTGSLSGMEGSNASRW